MCISLSRHPHLLLLLLFLALGSAWPADARDFSVIAGLWDVADMNLDDGACDSRLDDSQCSLPMKTDAMRIADVGRLMGM